MTYDPFGYWNTKRLRVQWMPDIAAMEAVAFTEWLPELKPWPERILEVGSGLGRVYELIQEFWQARYTGCDLSHWLAARFLGLYGKAPVQANGLALPYPDRSFDLVVSWDVMLHVPPDNIRGFIRDHLRVARRWLYVATLAGDGHKREVAPHCFVHDYLYWFTGYPGWSVRVDNSFGNRAHYYLECQDND